MILSLYGIYLANHADGIEVYDLAIELSQATPERRTLIEDRLQ